MKLNFSVLLAIFWLLVQVGNILFNLKWYLLPQNRLFLYLLIVIFVASVLVLVYLALSAYAPKAMYKINKKGRCPDCYSKIGGSGFCPKCGKDLTGRENARICPNCGYEELNAKSTSCPKCGRDFYR